MSQSLHRTDSAKAGATILYLHGFASGPDSMKGRALERRFTELGVSFQCIDLTPGDEGFERSTPLTMLAEAQRQVAAARPRALIGSSLGGYLAALIASRQRSRPSGENCGSLAGGDAVERVVLLAPAFRFFERWRARTTPEEEQRWRRDGLEVQHYASKRTRRLSWAFMEDAAKLPAYPDVGVPCLCLAGRKDEVVPLTDVEPFAAANPSAKLVVLEDGHDLVASLEAIFREAREFLGPLLGR